jgi:hypothetical protein
MKLHIATLTFDNNAGTVSKDFFFVTLGNKCAGQIIYRLEEVGIKAGRSSNDWDNLPSTLRYFINQASLPIKDAINQYVDMDFSITQQRTIQLREVVGAEREWFMTYGYGVHTGRVFMQIIDNFYDHKRTVGYRIHNALRARYEKLVGGYGMPPLVAHYKGMEISYEHAYRHHRAFCKRIGALVNQAIKDNDASDFEQEFMSEYGHRNAMHNRMFNSIEDVLIRNNVDRELVTAWCDHVEWRDELTEVEVHGRTRDYCTHCRDNDDVLVYTDDTNEYIRRQDAYWDDYRDVWLAEEPEQDIDPDDNDEDTSSLMSYRTNVLDHLEMDESFESSPFGEFHMGIELEIVTRASVNDAVENVRAYLGEDYCICKTDGSLPSGGLEIVTAPRSLAEHITKFKDWTIDSDYYAWNGGKCGMHIHMDSRAFTKLTLGKFIMFINTDGNADFIRKLAGRHPLRDEQARSYCASEYQPAMENPSKALKGKSPHRYHMVNTTCLSMSESNRLGVQYVNERSFNTIELRIFRASLKKARLLAQIEFTHAAVMFCRVASMRDLNEQGFLKWLKATDNRYPHLADWYGIRRRVGAMAAPTAPADATTTTTVSE